MATGFGDERSHLRPFQGLDLMAVTETFLSDAIYDGELGVAGYSVYRMAETGMGE